MTYLIRKAVSADLETMWVWRNDPVTRRMARVEGPVGMAQYRAWFHMVSGSSDHLMLAGDHGGALIGYATFAPFWERGRWTISLTLGPAHRARGHGSALVPLFVREAARRLPIREIVAHIRAENGPSRKAFARAGFHDCGAETGIHRYRLPVRAGTDKSSMDQSSGSPRLSGRDAHAPRT